MQRRIAKVLALVLFLSLLPYWGGIAWAVASVTEDGSSDPQPRTVDSVDSPHTIGVYAEAGTSYDSAAVEVTGDVTVNNTLTSGEAAGVTVSTDYHPGTTASASVGGDVTVTSIQSAVGTRSVAELGGTASTTVKGNVSAEAATDYNARGVIAVSGTDTGSASVSVDGSVSAEVSGSGEATGVIARSQSGQGTSTVSVGSVSSTSESNDSVGIVVSSKEAEGTVTVDVQEGEVEAHSGTGRAIAIKVGESTSSEGSITVDANGQTVVAASAGGHAVGVLVGEGTAFSGEALIDTGDVAAYGQTSRGIFVENQSSDGTVIHAESIEANAANDATGVMVQAEGAAETEITVDNITVETGSGTGIGADLTSNTSSSGMTTLIVNGDISASDIGVQIDAGKGSINLIDKGENISGGDTGLKIVEATDEASVNAIVHSTISGNSAGIVVSDSVNTDNINIAVWKITDQNDDGHVVLQENASGSRSSGAASEALEQQIQYIIKMEPSISVDTPLAPFGEPTATEGTRVNIVKVNVPAGYVLTGAYNGVGEKTALYWDSTTGSYYIDVPRGGGVYLSAVWSKIATHDSGSGSSSGSGWTGSDYTPYNTGKVDYVDVTFDLNGGHTISGNPGPIVKSVPVGSWVILLDAPRKDSSIFECWHTDDKTVKVSAPYESFQVMNSITFTAKWLDEELPYVPTAEEESLVSEFSFVPLEGVEILDLTEAAVPEIEEEAITDAAGEASPAEEIPIVQLPDENVPAIEETAADAEKAQPAAISISAEVPAAEIGSLLTIPATLRVEVAGSTLEIPVNVNISLATPAS